LPSTTMITIFKHLQRNPLRRSSSTLTHLANMVTLLSFIPFMVLVVCLRVSLVSAPFMEVLTCSTPLSLKFWWMMTKLQV
jgi:hypothetical protein